MEEFRTKVDELLSWNGRDLKNFAISLSVGVGVMVLGFLLMFSIPAWVVKSAETAAADAIASAGTTQKSATLRDRNESPWFALQYTNAIPGLFSEADVDLKSAQSLLEQNGAVFSADEKLTNANSAQNAASAAESKLQEVVKILDNNLLLRVQALQSLNTTVESAKVSDDLYDLVRKRFDIEQGQYHPKYMNPLENNLIEVVQREKSAEHELQSAIDVLPENTATDHRGDPTLALTHLDAAKVKIDEINTLMTAVTAELDYQKLAMAEAAPKTAEAENTSANSNNYVDQIKRKTGYWLNQSGASLASSLSQLQLAQWTLATFDQGYIDYPVAYEAALESIKLANEAVAQADTEVALAQSATNAIAQVNASVITVRSKVNEAISSQSVLESRHANSTWGSVSTNVSQASTLVDSATRRNTVAGGYMSLQVQRFADAFAEAQSAQAELATAQNLAEEVVGTSSRLEGFRIEWPNAESRATQTIESERPQVNQYGSYSYSAKSDFQNAESLLSSARSEAGSRKFEPAVDQADQATSLAQGTGSRAYGAYEDYQDEQERQRQAAEEAAQEAARQAQEESSSSGGSSCCDSSSSGSDSGSGGSDYGGSDYGGGSDSDSGGGSDSDW